jgi:cellulose synthase (UDP-forming)
MESLVPLMLLGAAALAFPRSWMARRQIQAAVALATGLMVARYLHWRATVTVFPAEGFNPQSVFVWALFLVELLAWADAVILFAALLRRTNLSGDADDHERRLRAASPADLPEVDVFIATFNEPIEVLEKTIVGALALDWPKEKLCIRVLDDGGREWLRDFCEEKGAVWMTRDDNAHAKAGNINAAIARTTAPYFMVLDADFIPRRDFLYRALGFFADPEIGIVQIPHNFFNHDPMQASLDMRQTLPDDQRLFFDAIMPGRDGWDCAFCCGSNSITRRSALEAVGGALPTGSVTEDMLLTLALLRKGFKTRYLNERLAVGLAPESLSAFFVQRARWARGAIQILFLKEGPLGPGLSPIQRLMFLPTHWISQSLTQVMAMATPAIFLWTGLLPLLNANTATVVQYQVPAILATLLAVRMFAPGAYFPLAATAHAVLQAFRLLPTVLMTLIRPHGHAFKVTPKGSDAVAGGIDWPTVVLTLSLMLATSGGLLVNADFNLQIVGNGALVPVVAFWAVANMIVLIVVATIAVSPPMLRAEERFAVELPARIVGDGLEHVGEVVDLSLSGGLVVLRAEAAEGFAVGDWRVVEIAGIGRIPALVRRVAVRPAAGRAGLGLEFDLRHGLERDRLICALFAEGLDNSTHTDNSMAVSIGMLLRVVRRDKLGEMTQPCAPVAPDWVHALAAPPQSVGAGWVIEDRAVS